MIILEMKRPLWFVPCLGTMEHPVPSMVGDILEWALDLFIWTTLNVVEMRTQFFNVIIKDGEFTTATTQRMRGSFVATPLPLPRHRSRPQVQCVDRTCQPFFAEVSLISGGYLSPMPRRGKANILRYSPTLRSIIVSVYTNQSISSEKANKSFTLFKFSSERCSSHGNLSQGNYLLHVHFFQRVSFMENNCRQSLFRC